MVSPEISLDSIHGESGEFTVRGNVCAAIGNCAAGSDALERMAHTAELVAAVVHLLGTLSDWCAGQAARTLGNLAANSQTCVQIRTHSGMEEQVFGAMGELVTSTISERTRCRAMHAVANLCGDDEICKGLWMVPDLYITLSETQSQGYGGGTPEGAEESLTRALVKMSQVRYGVSTWRAPAIMH